jgi:hypothetical protein
MKLRLAAFAATMLLAPALVALPGYSDVAHARKLAPEKEKKQVLQRATTVKSSKSNSSDRIVLPKSTTGVARATTVKSSKSNSSDRFVLPKGTTGWARATTVKSSKSNSSDRLVRP